MSEVDRIVDQLQRAYDGDAWYGPSVRGAVDGVDAAQASARPLPAAHSIWEIVLHLTAWTREVTRRLRIGVAQDPADGDWPAAPAAADASPAAWTSALAALDAAQAALVTAVAALDDAQLESYIGDARDRPLGSGVSRYVLLHGLIQHHVYHAGQIAILGKAARPS